MRFQEFSFNVRAMKRLYKANLVSTTQDKRSNKSFVSNEYDVHNEGGDIAIPDGYLLGAKTDRSETYKTKDEEKPEANDYDAIIDLLT